MMVAAKAIPRSLFFALMQALPRRSSDTQSHGSIAAWSACKTATGIRGPGRPSRRAQNEDVQRRSLRCQRATGQNNLQRASSDVPERRRLLMLCQKKSHSVVPLSRTRRRSRKDGTPVTKLALQRGASRRAEHNNSQLSTSVVPPHTLLQPTQAANPSLESSRR